MPNEIAQAVILLDQKIASLKRLRDQLVEEFGQSGHAVAEVAVAPARTSGTEYVTRKDQVYDFIKVHGPSTRGQIIAGTGIPAGTAAYVLNDERFINRNGKWCIADSKSSAIKQNPPEGITST